MYEDSFEFYSDKMIDSLKFFTRINDVPLIASIEYILRNIDQQLLSKEADIPVVNEVIDTHAILSKSNYLDQMKIYDPYFKKEFHENLQLLEIFAFKLANDRTRAFEEVEEPKKVSFFENTDANRPFTTSESKQLKERLPNVY